MTGQWRKNKVCVQVLFLIAAYCWVPVVRAETPRVVVSIAPLHSLVASVMVGVGVPDLLISAGQSPHHAALKPSIMRKVSQADLLVMVDPHCLERSLGQVAQRKPPEQQLNIHQVAGIRRLMYPAEHTHGGCDYDPHLWLDPNNAIQIVRAVSAALVQLDPSHRALYEQNQAATIARLTQLHARVLQQLSQPLPPYIVYHNAYAYFERRYGLSALFTVLKNPEIQPGIKRIRDVRRQIRAANVTCLFTEPQFPSKLVRPITAGNPLTVIVLDPLGYRLTPGADLYFELLDNMAVGFSHCLQTALHD